MKRYEKDGYYHLYNRGVDGTVIFMDENEYSFFIRRLRENSRKHEISVMFYCLMPNHFHIFVKQLTKEKSTGRMAGDLTNSYTKAINTKYTRTGVLLEGRTEAKVVSDTAHFIYLVK